MEDKKIAVVTGANRGIGFETVRQLATAGMKVVLTSRDEIKGQESANKLKAQGLDVVYHQLDVTNQASISKFADFLKESFGRVDVLVNNAGIAADFHPVLETSPDIIRQTFETNVLGAFLVSQAIFPIMKVNNSGRIINLSSGMGQLSEMGSGYPGYRISKTALNAVTKILSNEDANIYVNSVCPGWVRTDMGGPNARLSVDQGADTVAWLATTENSPNGSFFRNRKPIPW